MNGFTSDTPFVKKGTSSFSGGIFMPSKSSISMFTHIYCVFHYFCLSRGMMNYASLIICIDLLGDDLNIYQ